jgi:hypothetical protein
MAHLAGPHAHARAKAGVDDGTVFGVSFKWNSWGPGCIDD